MIKCPHCNKIIYDEKHEKAERNVENYGSNIFNFKCLKCKKIYSVYFSRTVTIGKPWIREGVEESF